MSATTRWSFEGSECGPSRSSRLRRRWRSPIGDEPILVGTDGREYGVVIVHDHRVRFPGDGLLVGDRVRLRSGGSGVIISTRRDGEREFICAVPEEMIDDERWAKIYSGDYMG